MQEQELFQSYEVKNWDFNPRIYKILAVSAIFNIFALFVVGQTNLLTTKGCDSPLVGGVCQVLDTLYVGGTVLTTDSQYVEGDYTKTELENAEIIWVDRTGAEDFKYPEGYFAVSNPELLIPQEIQGGDPNAPFPIIPGMPNPTIGGGGTADLLSKPQELPQNNPNAVTGNLPSSPFTFEGSNPTIPRGNGRRVKYPKVAKNNPTVNNNDSPNKLPELKPDQTADKDPNKQNNNKIDPSKVTPTPDADNVSKEDNYGIYKNKKPLKDFANKAKEEVKNVKLEAPFSVTISADLGYGKDGKTIILKNPKPVMTDPKTPNDAQMAKLAKDAILAIGDSGWLGYLNTIGIKKVVFTLSQDDNFMTAKILGEQKDENSAKTSASGLSGLITLGRNATDGDEKVLLEGAQTTSEGKSVILNVVIPKQIALEMINRKLKEAEEKSAEPKPNGNTGQIKEINQNTTK